MAAFTQLFEPSRDTTILDVGGLPRFWEGTGVESHITILNLDPLDDYERGFLTERQTYRLGDGTDLPYRDEEFDIVFSNSVIEHVGTHEQQCRLASEISRVGRGYWVQTPAKEFPIEPHYLAPFVHWLPHRWQKKLLRRFSLWGLIGRPSKVLVDMAIAEVRLLRYRHFKAMFPDATLRVERLLGWPKSYIACRLA